MPKKKPPPEKLSVTFKLDQDHYEQDLLEARVLARQGVPVFIIIPPGLRIITPLELEDNMTIQGEISEVLPLKIKE